MKKVKQAFGFLLAYFRVYSRAIKVKINKKLSPDNKHFGDSMHRKRCAAKVSCLELEDKNFMKILLAIIALLTWQISVVSAQKTSKQTTDPKTETIVPVIKQTGSLRFRCLEKPDVFNNSYELESRVKGNETCVNPADLLRVDFEKQTLIGYQISGDCHVRGRAEVFRSDAAQTVRVEIKRKSGECAAVGDFQGWTVVEKLPEDYKVEFFETPAEDKKDFKIELLEETLSLTETAQNINARDYEIDGCPQSYRRGSYIIKSEAELVKDSLDAASRKRCLDKKEKVDFKKEILIGTTIYSGYCRYPNGLKHQVMRDDRQKRYVVFITYDDPYGRTCRALGIYDLWLAVPKPPDDYEIKVEVASVLNKKYDY